MTISEPGLSLKKNTIAGMMVLFENEIFYYTFKFDRTILNSFSVGTLEKRENKLQYLTR